MAGKRKAKLAREELGNAALDFWIAVQRMDQPYDPDSDDDDEAGSGVPKRPAPASGSTGPEAEPPNDLEKAEPNDAEPRAVSQRD